MRTAYCRGGIKINMKIITNLWIADDVSLVTIENMPNSIESIALVFDKMSEHGVNLDMISLVSSLAHTTGMSFTMSDEECAKALSVINGLQQDMPGIKVFVNAGNTKLSVYGEQMRNTPGACAQVFSVLAGHGIEVKMITTSEVDISVLIATEYADAAVAAVADRFGLELQV